MGPSSVTHSFDAGQRFLRLNIEQWKEENNCIKVRTPANTNECPPGH